MAGANHLKVSISESEFFGQAASLAFLIGTIGTALLCGSDAAYAGPCTEQIAQFEQKIDVTAPGPASGPTATQTVGAQLHRQPTPGSVQNAEGRANADGDAALARARKADAAGNAAAADRRLTKQNASTASM